ncbi:uncharacterized protein MONBRDRAFT_19343 [Monosiga brevicollis MX1]|uniref:RNA helicase n=1 Tax=Monosiga brevicollis TaxID=81824 RepID=A9UQQ5_MONBE|nr:uncharacterized protein MONBRDRAFT_19343 [Monosiga brevicollis MX1]EDQ93088.1 predicted protein [Monosiga brevicollis MX1]|eukprot:XP_001742850.1 hypothetical protein [Monosiga brevicollis MX1]
MGWGDFGLDGRLLKAIGRLGWGKPTLIQQHAIRELMNGRDVLARARTGSGKTGAYTVPLLNVLLSATDEEQGVLGIVLVPTKELAFQVTENIKELAKFCLDVINVGVLATNQSKKQLKSLAASKPPILVGTPTRILQHIQNEAKEVRQTLKLMILDEADLLFSYGYHEDLRRLCALLPRLRQTILMSATMGDDVNALKELALRNPAVIKLEESDLPDEDQLKQYKLYCEPSERLLHLCALLKFQLVRGKTLIFVNDIDSCYRVKLFLDKFGIRCCVLNSELPLNSRRHIVSQFNKGVYDYIIASDEGATGKSLWGGICKRGKGRAEPSADQEYGVARGVDFKGIKNVINFDFPATAAAYVHRVGRTARGHRAGLALSFYLHADNERVAQVERLLEVAEAQEQEEAETAKPNSEASAHRLVAYSIDKRVLDKIRYRVEDVLSMVSRNAIKKARRAEIENEILNSEKLQAHFEDNPKDLEVLRHDRNLQQRDQHMHHLKHLPAYIKQGVSVPAIQSGANDKNGRAGGANGKRRPNKNNKSSKRRKDDPLKAL